MASVVILGVSINVTVAGATFEEPPTFQASEILPFDLLRSEHHRVDESVTNDGYLNIFRIESDFGPYEAAGAIMLAIRVKEIGALAELQDLSETEVFIESAGKTAVSQLDALWTAVTNPVQTVEGLPSGIVRIFRDYEEDIETGIKITGDITGIGQDGEAGGEGDDGYTEEEIVKAMEAHFGVRSAQRRRAHELGIDPYTSNENLRAALNEIARVERAARYGMKLVPIPSIPGASFVQSAVDAIYTKDYRALREYNRDRLVEAGVDDQYLNDFFNHPYINPTLQTIIASALIELEQVEDRDFVIAQAIAVGTEEEAFFFAETLSLLVWFNDNEAKLVRFLPDIRMPIAMTADRRVITLLPVDYLSWTSGIGAAAGQYRQAADRHRADGYEMWFLGDVSPRARRELEAMGWTVKEDVATEIGWAPDLKME